MTEQRVTPTNLETAVKFLNLCIQASDQEVATAAYMALTRFRVLESLQRVTAYGTESHC